MPQLTSYNTIGPYGFDFVADVAIESTWKEMTDTCHISIPKKLIFQDNKEIVQAITIGMPVSINLGWDWNLNNEFTGWVARSPQPTIPFKIFCEDNMYLLKRGNLQKRWSSVTLSQLLDFILLKVTKPDGSPINITYQTLGDINLGPFHINNATPAKVLAFLKQRYGLISYFKGNALYVGKVHTLQGNTVTYKYGSNIIKNNLAWKLKEEVRLKVEAVSILPSNKQIKVAVYSDNTFKGERSTEADEGYEVHTLHCGYNITDKNQLIMQAQAFMDTVNYDGWRGTFKAFGDPFISHSDIAVMLNDYYPEKNGNYYADRVKTFFGPSHGYKREIELGSRA